MKLNLTVNDRPVCLETEPHRRLLDVLRNDLGLVGTKEGCGEGECGACTVIIDDQVVNSCLIPVGQADGARIQTIEGVDAKGPLHAVQDALVVHGGVQCGICTPGIVLSCKWALETEPAATRDRLRVLLAGNICRCTGYESILDAVMTAQRERNEDPT